MGRWRRVVPLVAWIGALAAVLTAMTAIGNGALAGPDLLHPAAWSDWLAGRDPLVAVVAILRLVVVGLGWYLAAVTLLEVVARLSRSVRMVRVADALAVPGVRRLVQSALSASVATAVATGGVAAAAPLGPPALEPVPSVTATVDDVPTAQPLPPAADDATPPSPSPESRPQTDIAADHPATPSHAVTSDDAAALHTVVPGEHLWAIAEATLAERLGAPPTVAQIDPYWRRLIAANRDRLADRDNPDLIYPGQQFVLPAADGGAS